MIAGLAVRERPGTAPTASPVGLAVVAALLALAGAAAVVARGDASVEAGGAAVGEAGAEQAPARATPAAPPGDPVRVRIPAIGVVAPLVRLGLNTDGTLEVPRFEEAGWYGGRSRPGDVGPAVIAAHVDSKAGPAVFYRLRDVQPGDVVHVDYAQGTVSFTVRESGTFAKSGFPTDRVYGPTEGPELRLVTCDGVFDRGTGSYRSNLVVWAGAAGAGHRGT